MKKNLNSKIEKVVNSSCSFINYLNNIAPDFEPFIEHYVNLQRTNYENQKHKDIDKYLYNPINDYVKNYGKLHRPLTCLAVYKACNGQSLDNVIPVASSIEIFQTAALIHDDIADGASLRRGKPCLHKSQGEGVAINAGDFGLSMVIGIIMQEFSKGNINLEGTQITKIIDELIRMEYTTIEGQAMDLGWARDNRFDISAKDYMCMATKKSAYYSIVSPCVLGALCASANNKIIDTFIKFGIQVGLAFQIQDDILNLIDHDKASKRKDFLNDITEGKRTLIVVDALSKADAIQKKQLIDILQSHTTDSIKLNHAVDIMNDLGSINYAVKISKKFSQNAKDILKDNIKPSKWRDLLEDMADWAGTRNN